MKIKPVDRILLALYALIGAALSIALAFVAYYGDRFSLTFLGYTFALAPGLWPFVTVCVLSLALLLWSIRMMMLAFRHEPRIDKTSVSVQNTEHGSVRVSVAAMDTLIHQAIGHQEGIRDIRSKIVNHEDSISVHIDMTLSSDVHIPNITMLLQRTVKNFIEEFSGIAVREVTVLVSSIVEIVPAPLAIESQSPSSQKAPDPEPEPAEPTFAPDESEEMERLDLEWNEDLVEDEPSPNAFADETPPDEADENNPEDTTW